MEQFERQFENMDIATDAVESAINQTTAQTTPQEEVDSLIAQVADEAGLELSGQLDAAGRVGTTTAPARAETDQGKS